MNKILRGTWVLAVLAASLLALHGCMKSLPGLSELPEDSDHQAQDSQSPIPLAPAGSSSTQAAIPPLHWPTDPGAGISSGFGADWVKLGCDGRRKLHAGIDIAVGKDRPVYAAEDGKVVGRGSSSAHPEWKEFVTIQHELGSTVFTTVYWHIDPSVKVGDPVKRGQPIGKVADMGTNTHLHFGVRLAPYGDKTPDGKIIANLGALPRTTDCPDGPRFPEKFVNPLNYYRPTVSNANQYRSDGITVIPEGQAIRENTVVFKATVSDPKGWRVRVQIELRQITEPFSGTPTWTSDLVRSGTQVSWTRSGLVDAGYKWRFRAVDEGGLASPWQEFGTPGNTDFMVDRTLPTPPRNLRVTGSTFSRIDLAWAPSTDNLSGVASYRIYRDGRHHATVPGTQTSFRDGNVRAWRQYCYQVSAVDRAGNESFLSNVACARAVPWPR